MGVFGSSAVCEWKKLQDERLPGELDGGNMMVMDECVMSTRNPCDAGGVSQEPRIQGARDGCTGHRWITGDEKPRPDDPGRNAHGRRARAEEMRVLAGPCQQALFWAVT